MSDLSPHTAGENHKNGAQLMNRYSVLGVCAAVGLATIAAVGQASGAAASGTSHAVTAASKSNFSSAMEHPSWSFSCNSATKTWRFAINGVQVIDAASKPWNQNNRVTGPWRINVFASTTAGPIPFSRVAKLGQNTTNGLFTATVASTAANAATWCQTGTSVSVVGFSGSDEPLLLDGTLS